MVCRSAISNKEVSGLFNSLRVLMHWVYVNCRSADQLTICLYANSLQASRQVFTVAQLVVVFMSKHLCNIVLSYFGVFLLFSMV